MNKKVGLNFGTLFRWEGILVILIIGGFMIYFPIVSFMGYWDERSLNTFKRAMALSGPSLWMIYPLYKMFNRFYRLSPFKKQSAVKMGEEADKELKELMILRHQRFMTYSQEDVSKQTENQNN